MKYAITTFLCFLFHTVFTQMPDNFEFLDHSSQFQRLGPSLQLNDSIVYVTHNQDWPMTSVRSAKSNYTLNNLFDTYFTGDSKLVKNADGSADIFIYNLVDYDIVVEGFFCVSIQNGISVAEDFSFSENFELNPFFEVGVSDVARNDMNSYWILGFDVIYLFDGTAISNEISLPNAHSYSFYKSSIGDIFLYKDNILYSFDGSQISEHQVMDSDIISIENIDGKNIVRLENKILHYDDSFDFIVSEWMIPNINSAFSFFEDWLYYTEGNDYFVAILRTNNQGALEPVAGLDQSFETLVRFDMLTDSSLFIQGTYDPFQVFRNTIFRTVVLDAPPAYNKSYVDLTSFRVEQINKDSIYQEVIVDGDSIFLVYYDYALSFEFYNDSDSDVYALNAFTGKTTPFDPFGPFNSSLSYRLNELLPAESFYSIFDTTRVYATSANMPTLKISIPGANYSFNKGQFFLRVTSFITSAEDLELTDSQTLVYPNPADNMIYIDRDSNADMYKMYNADGILVKAGSLNDYSIDVAALDSGMYYLVLASAKSNTTNTQKIMIQ